MTAKKAKADAELEALLIHEAKLATAQEKIDRATDALQEAYQELTIRNWHIKRARRRIHYLENHGDCGFRFEDCPMNLCGEARIVVYGKPEREREGHDEKGRVPPR